MFGRELRRGPWPTSFGRGPQSRYERTLIDCLGQASSPPNANGLTGRGAMNCPTKSRAETPPSGTYQVPGNCRQPRRDSWSRSAAIGRRWPRMPAACPIRWVNGTFWEKGPCVKNSSIGPLTKGIFFSGVYCSTTPMCHGNGRPNVRRRPGTCTSVQPRRERSIDHGVSAGAAKPRMAISVITTAPTDQRIRKCPLTSSRLESGCCSVCVRRHRPLVAADEDACVDWRALAAALRAIISRVSASGRTRPASPRASGACRRGPYLGKGCS